MTLSKILVASALTLSAIYAQAYGYGGGYGRDRGGGSACQDALSNLRYAQQRANDALRMVQGSNQTCGNDMNCRAQISAVWQQSVRDLQDAEDQRRRACN